MRYLLISGSPRKGNTEFILNSVFNLLKGEKDLILLRNKNIKHCSGCLSCDKTKKCAINDKMQEIYKKIEKADFLIIGTPNYFDNVPGLLKDFFDRTNPFYETDKIKGKKMIAIVTGGGKVKNSQKVVSGALKNFADAHGLNFVKSFVFEALQSNELKKSGKVGGIVRKIIQVIK